MIVESIENHNNHCFNIGEVVEITGERTKSAECREEYMYECNEFESGNVLERDMRPYTRGKS